MLKEMWAPLLPAFNNVNSSIGQKPYLLQSVVKFIIHSKTFTLMKLFIPSQTPMFAPLKFGLGMDQ